MADELLDSHAEILAQKHGFPIYDRNPSVPDPSGPGLPTRLRPVKIANGNRALLIGSDTGEIFGKAHAAFFEMQAVDQGQFVKIYLEGVRNTVKLSQTGLKVFEIVYNQMREKPQTDRIELNFYLAQKFNIDLSARSYRRGIRELLEHAFVFRSPSADVYFININFMFNGNRVSLTKTYYLHGQGNQGELFAGKDAPTQSLGISSEGSG